MTLSDLGMSYDDYKRSEYFVRLRKMVGVGHKKCQLCRKRIVRIPHHLHYKSLTHESKRDMRGLCFPCNNKAHFYSDGRRVPVTRDGVYLIRRYNEISSWWYKLKQLRPSSILDPIWNWYAN